MRFLKPVSRRTVVAYATALGLIAVVGLVPWSFVSATASAADPDKAIDKAASTAPEKALYQAPKKATDNVAQKDRTERGWFVYFADGVLALRNRGGLVKIKLPENTKTFVWNHDEGRSQGVETAEAMRQLEALYSPVDSAESMLWRKAGIGMVVQVANENVTIHIGENKAPYAGNFVSFKEDYLFIRIKNPKAQFQKAYGDTVRFRMNEDIAVYESIDGGEYKSVGSPRAAFRNVKEGTELSVYHYYKTETDEFYLILIGLKKK